MKKRIGIVVPGLEQGGGVPAVAEFLCQAIDRSDRYAAGVISVATSSQDPQSVRLLSPASWVQGVSAAEGSWRGRSYRHYGAPLAEVEFMRYRPRRLLTEQLNRYSLVQIVAGAPAWAMVARKVHRPVVLQVATLVRVERATLLGAPGGLTGVWRRWMTRSCTPIEDEALRHVDAVFVENNWMLEHLRRRGCRRVVFAPPGVDTDLFRPARAARQARTTSSPWLGSVTRARTYGCSSRRMPSSGRSGPGCRGWSSPAIPGRRRPTGRTPWRSGSPTTSRCGKMSRHGSLPSSTGQPRCSYSPPMRKAWASSCWRRWPAGCQS